MRFALIALKARVDYDTRDIKGTHGAEETPLVDAVLMMVFDCLMIFCTAK